MSSNEKDFVTASFGIFLFTRKNCIHYLTVYIKISAETSSGYRLFMHSYGFSCIVGFAFLRDSTTLAK